MTFIPRLLLSLVGLFLATSVSPLRALEVPKKPEGYVTDRARLLSPEVISRMEQVLGAFERKTSNQIFIVTFPSLEGESLEDFSVRLAETWKPGQKGRDNGVLILIFKEERRMRIEVGYGLEGVLPDALAGQIIEEIMTPAFKKEQFEIGILTGVQAVIKATEGEYQAAGRSAYDDYASREFTDRELRSGRRAGHFIFFAVTVIALIDLFRYGRYRAGHRRYPNRYRFLEWWIRFAVLCFLLNLIFRMMFYAALSSRGGYYGTRTGFGGFSGGGGRFGGGGASGRW